MRFDRARKKMISFQNLHDHLQLRSGKNDNSSSDRKKESCSREQLNEYRWTGAHFGTQFANENAVKYLIASRNCPLFFYLIFFLSLSKGYLRMFKVREPM